MKEIQTWKYTNLWVAKKYFNENREFPRYAINVTGNGQTKKQAIIDLNEALINLNKDITKVIGEINLKYNK